MATNIGELLVSIGLDSSKFNPALKQITNNIRDFEKQLRGMDKEFGDVSKSITGLEKKFNLYSKAMEENRKAVAERTKIRDQEIETLRDQSKELERLKSLEKSDERDKAIVKQEKAIESQISKIRREDNAIDKLNSTYSNYINNQEKIAEQIKKIKNGYQSYEETIESINEQKEISNSISKAEQNILEAHGKTLKAYDKQVEIHENNLRSAVEAYKANREESAKNESEISKLTSSIEKNQKALKEQESTLESVRKIYGENSIEYRNQLKLIEQTENALIREETARAELIKTNSEIDKSAVSMIETATEEYKALKELGSTKLTKGLKKTSNVLESVSQATKGVSTVSAGVGTGATAMFQTYETGLAKLSTLVDTSVVDMDKVGKDIIRISNETGTSIGDTLEGAYQAVSAGVEIGNLNDFLATSSKLATSGFTDMSSATKVLSQIMNNYGTSAGNAEEIASKLMKTQNLGVTTVAELSSEMSESLSLASTFGMSFDNVATAFAKMTKAGTSTNEAGTAIARMMEELGDTSSEVSEILKDKTGKSFTELAKGGSSLFDILTILQQHADETGVSMTELWGSSNAGKNFLCLSI